MWKVRHTLAQGRGAPVVRQGLSPLGSILVDSCSKGQCLGNGGEASCPTTFPCERLNKFVHAANKNNSPVSDHWSKIIGARIYDCDKNNNRARINMEGSLTLKNIIQNIGTKLVSDLGSKNSQQREICRPDAQRKPLPEQLKLEPGESQREPEPANHVLAAATTVQDESLEQQPQSTEQANLVLLVTSTICEQTPIVNPAVAQAKIIDPHEWNQLHRLSGRRGHIKALKQKLQHCRYSKMLLCKRQNKFLR